MERKNNMVFKKGYIPWNKGKKGLQAWSEESRKNLSDYMKKKVLLGKCALSHRTSSWNKGLRGLQSGENAPNWKGGKTSLSKIIREQIDIINLSKQRKEMDDFTCQICGKRGGDLQTDHYPISFAEILTTYHITSLEEALSCEALKDINNLRTLCVICHRMTKTFGRTYNISERDKSYAREAIASNRK